LKNNLTIIPVSTANEVLKLALSREIIPMWLPDLE
jgi:hypothetical protein